MAVTATIQRYTVGYGLAGHVEYVIKVVFHGQEWATRKRYSEFDRFDRKIRKAGYNIPRRLPPKVILGKYYDDVILTRMKELDLYLLSVLSLVPSDNCLLREFLEVDLNLLTASMRAPSPTKHVKYIDRITAIFNRAVNNFINLNVQWRLSNCGDIISSRKRYIRQSWKHKKKKAHSAHSISDLRRARNSSASSSNVDLLETNSSTMDAADTALLRGVIRERYLAYADSKWGSLDSIEDSHRPSFADTDSCIYDYAERTSNELYIENNHIMSVLSSPPDADVLARASEVGRQVHASIQTAMQISTPLSHLVTDLPEREFPSMSRAKSMPPLKKKPRERPPSGNAVLRIRMTLSDSGANKLPGSNRAQSAGR
mmetsp:Transcript_3839/g.5972  ORF Transcript_3839/g.5972 Transcript_3839/m.5972 type:complete len:371 (+) Transcript_3839:166-1278(+)|eukprot:CAMPEP_0185032288 /NCGR_PEP_ID=MMETSP1103-20130426/20246_1 /TAXON_ID=36769 /ORGANISM="Paraphysomonas bandaiensis, Strain Caron Lab Isolate" /LENGTH=370 /DNA_ID=CAMNT_0027568123 /DNA_START=93 /DNA_END=1205 /DNA_ORIENTATION=-